MLDALRGGSGLNALLVLEGSLMGRKQEADPEAHAEIAIALRCGFYCY